MSKKLGAVIKQLRINVKLSQVDLSTQVFCSQELISKIEKGTRSVSSEMLIMLSKVLKYDLVSLAKEIDDFEKFEHYKVYNELVLAIEKQNANDLLRILECEIVKNEFNYEKVYLKKLYCECIVLAGVYKKPKESLEKCYLILGINQESLNQFVLKLDKDRDYYACTNVLLKNLHDLGLKKQRDTVINNIIYFLEEYIFNEFRPISTIDYFWKRYCICIFNNKAQILFEEMEYDKALKMCEKTIIYSIELQTLFLLHYLYKLQIEMLLELRKGSEAKKFFHKFQSACFFNNEHAYFQQSINFFEEKYEIFFNR